MPGQIKSKGAAPSPAYVTEFLASSDGLALTKAFTRIKEPELRRRIVRLVEEIAGDSRSALLSSIRVLSCIPRLA